MLPSERQNSRSASLWRALCLRGVPVGRGLAAPPGRATQTPMRSWVAVSCAILLGCSGCRKTTPAAADAGAPDAPAPTTSAAPVGSSSSEEGWAEARSGDPLELARLADLEGVDRLAEVAVSEQASLEDRATAIRALMFVDDPTPSVEALSKLVSDPLVERATLALQTLATVAEKRSPIEELEPGAWRVAGVALLEALKVIQGPARREVALRALNALADRGAVDRKAIPAR